MMMPDLDIYGSAKLLIDQHGDDRPASMLNAHSIVRYPGLIWRVQSVT